MKNLVKALTVVCAILMSVATVDLQAQPGGGGDRGGGDRGGRGGRGGWNMEDMQKRMNERQKEQLGSTDDEWSVIEPLLKAVQTKQWAMRMSGGGFGRGRGGSSEDTPKEVTELREILEDDSASADDIKAKLKAFRALKETQEKELDAARKELQKILTVKQEAYFVMNGTLK